MCSYWQKLLICCIIILYSLESCYEEPTLPNSLIPPSCHISQMDFIDTTSRITYMYQYDRVGNKIKSDDDKGNRTYTFDSNNEFIISQQVGGITLNYEYTGTPKRISRIRGGALSYEYTYEGNSLKTYIAREVTGSRTYTFTNGELANLTTDNGEKFEVKDGQISKRTDAKGNVINYTYSQGQLAQAEYLYSTTNVRQVVTYTYDSKKYYTNTDLLLHGFSILKEVTQAGPGLGDIGGSRQINNYQTINTKYYKKGADNSETLIYDRTLVYRHEYNQENYSLGYARSDGARSRFYYSYCK